MDDFIKIKGLVTVDVIRVDGTVEHICKDNPNLLTTVGRDWVHSRLYTNISTFATYIAVSSNAVAPDVSDTVLTGEISGNGLSRALGTVTHVAGSTTTLITYTFDSLGIFTNIQKAGLFTDATTGILVNENSFPTLNLISGDQLVINWFLTVL